MTLAQAAPAATTPDAPVHRDWTSLGLAGYGAALGGLLFSVAHRGILDDGYITLSYARTLAFHGVWGFNEFRTANTATSPLNVWLLALGTFVTRQPVVALGLVLIASTAATAAWLGVIGRRVGVSPFVLAGLATGLLVSSPLFASTVGMETFLGVAVLVGVARYTVDDRTVATGVLCGLAVLTRPDLAMPAGVLVLVLLRRPSGRKWSQFGRLALVAALVAVPWHLLSWYALGGFVPDTFAIKTAAAQFREGENFATGPYFLAQTWTRASVLIAAPCVLGLLTTAVSVVAWCRRPLTGPLRVAVAFGLGGVAHYAAYSLIGVPPYHWYYCPAVGLLVVAVAAGAASVAPRARTGVFAAGVLLIGVTAGTQLAAAVPWDQPVIYGNWATARQYAAVGQGVGRLVPRGETIGGFGEIGGVAFACDCDIIDPFTDRATAQRIIDERYAKAGPLGQWLLDLNYTHAERAPATVLDHQLVYTEGPGPGWRTEGPLRGLGHIELAR